MTKFFLHLAQRRYEDPNAPEARSACGKMAGLVGIGCNLLLFLAKLLVGFRLAEKPADATHPYGHARIEYLSGLAVAALVLLIGAELAKTSIDKIFHPQAIAFSALTAAVLLGSIAVKLWMAYFYRTVGTQIQSVTVCANACDSRNDVIATAAVLLGCLVSHFFSRNIDGYIGLAVAVFILWSGVGIAKDTIAPLLGESASPELKALVADPRAPGVHCAGLPLNLQVALDQDQLRPGLGVFRHLRPLRRCLLLCSQNPRRRPVRPLRDAQGLCAYLRSAGVLARSFASSSFFRCSSSALFMLCPFCHARAASAGIHRSSPFLSVSRILSIPISSLRVPHARLDRRPQLRLQRVGHLSDSSPGLGEALARQGRIPCAIAALARMSF